MRDFTIEDQKDVGGFKYTHPRVSTSIMQGKPGPEYALPPLVGYPEHDMRSTHRRYPAYSIGMRTDIERKDPGPGPAAYYPSISNTAPSYSLASRNKELSQMQSPGPAEYKVGNANAKRAPAYSFGLKGSDLQKNDTPGPNVYKLPPAHTSSSIPTAPAYSILKRPDSMFQGSAAPGPGEYTLPSVNKYKEQQPQWSMATGAQLPTDATLKPGPAEYLPKLDAAKRKAPHYTFGMKHSLARGEFASEPNFED